MKNLILLSGLIFLAACTTAIDKQPDGPNVGSNGLDYECVVDSDCAVGGCSSQLCLSDDLAKDMITTCEWREEYACYKLTSCGCVDNKCAWKENNEFSGCMENVI
jgi:eight-cysteine-cluster-containing protein